MNEQVGDFCRFLKADYERRGETLPKIPSPLIKACLLVAKSKTNKFSASQNVSVFTKKPEVEEFAEVPMLPVEKTSPAGKDGLKTARMLKVTKYAAIYRINKITKRALNRLPKDRFIQSVMMGPLFTPEDNAKLIDVIHDAITTANLLGRSNVQLRGQQAEDQPEKFSEDDETDFSSFAEVPVMSSSAAINFFKGLVPSAAESPSDFSNIQLGKSFSLAGVTNNSILRQIQGVILKRLENGEDVNGAPREIDKILYEAGIHPKNSQYSEMVFRTNMMGAYTQGLEQELKSPNLINTFPVWQYLGIRDGRQGEDHEPNFNKYYPASASFAQVRGARVFNCRCVPKPISIYQWRRLKGKGFAIADGYPDVPA